MAKRARDHRGQCHNQEAYGIGNDPSALSRPKPYGCSTCGRNHQEDNCNDDQGVHIVLELFEGFIGHSETPKLSNVDGIAPTLAGDQGAHSHVVREPMSYITEIQWTCHIRFAVDATPALIPPGRRPKRSSVCRHCRTLRLFPCPHRTPIQAAVAAHCIWRRLRNTGIRRGSSLTTACRDPVAYAGRLLATPRKCRAR